MRTMHTAFRLGHTEQISHCVEQKISFAKDMADQAGYKSG